METLGELIRSEPRKKLDMAGVAGGDIGSKLLEFFVLGAVTNHLQRKTEAIASGNSEINTLPGNLATRNDKRMIFAGLVNGALVLRLSFIGVFHRILHIVMHRFFHRFNRGRGGFRELLDVDRRIDDSSVTVVVFFDLFGGVARNSDEVIGLLRSGEISLTERLDEKSEEKFDDRIQETEAGVFEIAIVRLPIILRGYMAITDVSGMGLVGEQNFVFPFLGGSAIRFWLSADGFGFGASDRDDEVIVAKVKMRKIALTQRAEDTAKSGRKKVEPAGLDSGVFEPVDALWAVLGGVNRRIRVKMMKLEEDFFGATFFGEPITDEGNFHFAPFLSNTAPIVRRRMRKSSQRLQF